MKITKLNNTKIKHERFKVLKLFKESNSTLNKVHLHACRLDLAFAVNFNNFVHLIYFH